MRAGAELNGLALEKEYSPLRARAFSVARSSTNCERVLRRAFGPAEDLLLCPVDDELIGVVPHRPTIDDPEVVVGIGRAARLEGDRPLVRRGCARARGRQALRVEGGARPR